MDHAGSFNRASSAKNCECECARWEYGVSSVLNTSGEHAKEHVESMRNVGKSIQEQ